MVYRACHVELELDSSLVSEPDRLRDRVRQMFLLAKSSVDEELSGNAAPAGDGHAANGNGRRRDTTRRATASQVRAIHSIADRNGVELPDLLRARHGISTPDELLVTEASQLIDELKSAANGNGTGGRR